MIIKKVFRSYHNNYIMNKETKNEDWNEWYENGKKYKHGKEKRESGFLGFLVFTILFVMFICCLHVIDNYSEVIDNYIKTYVTPGTTFMFVFTSFLTVSSLCPIKTKKH